MFYWNGRLYYTMAGTNSLFWRFFVPDSGIVNPAAEHRHRRQHQLENTKGMFLDGNNLYTVSAVDGSLSRIPFVNGAPSGTSTVVNSKATGGIDWRGRALFLASVLPNVGPSAELHRDRATGSTARSPRRRPTPTAASPRTTGTSATVRAARLGVPTHDFLATGDLQRLPDRRRRPGVPSPTTQQVVGGQAQRRPDRGRSPSSARTSTAPSTARRRSTATAPSTASTGTSATAAPAPARRSATLRRTRATTPSS